MKQLSTETLNLLKQTATNYVLYGPDWSKILFVIDVVIN